MTAVRRAQAAKEALSESAQVTRDLVLVVDDDEQMLKLIKRVLERAGFECVAVGDGHAAHDAAVDWRPDIIVLDLMLGATTGEEILVELRKDFRTRLIPVIFLTVRSSLKDKVEHLLNGADDYVTKPFIPEELVARRGAVITRATTTRELNPLTGMSGNSDILREITNRLVGQERFAVLYPDIDAFKSYNDHYGFVRGDDVIKTLSTIILEVLEETPSRKHFAGHVGGDDFVILTEPGLAEPIADEITKRFDAAVPALYDLVGHPGTNHSAASRAEARNAREGFGASPRRRPRGWRVGRAHPHDRRFSDIHAA